METDRGGDLVCAGDLATDFPDRWAFDRTDFAFLAHRHGASTGAEKFEDSKPSWITQGFEHVRVFFEAHDPTIHYISRNVEINAGIRLGMEKRWGNALSWARNGSFI